MRHSRFSSVLLTFGKVVIVMIEHLLKRGLNQLLFRTSYHPTEYGVAICLNTKCVVLAQCYGQWGPDRIAW